MLKTRMILIIEDSEEDFQTAKRLLSKMTDRTISRCADAPSAIDFLHGHLQGHQKQDSWPAVILLDLNMPGEDGRSLLVKLKRDARLRMIPVVIITTSANLKT
jgi:CheY-like chemotaxis protein